MARFRPQPPRPSGAGPSPGNGSSAHNSASSFQPPAGTLVTLLVVFLAALLFVMSHDDNHHFVALSSAGEHSCVPIAAADNAAAASVDVLVCGGSFASHGMRRRRQALRSSSSSAVVTTAGAGAQQRAATEPAGVASDRDGPSSGNSSEGEPASDTQEAPSSPSDVPVSPVAPAEGDAPSSAGAAVAAVTRWPSDNAGGAGSSLSSRTDVEEMYARLSGQPYEIDPMVGGLRLAIYYRPNYAVPVRERPVRSYYASSKTRALFRGVLHNFSVMALAEFAANYSYLPDDFGAYCELAMFGLDVCRELMPESAESPDGVIPQATGNDEQTPVMPIVVQCALRFETTELLEAVLPAKCTTSWWFGVFRDIVAKVRTGSGSQEQPVVPRPGPIYQAEIAVPPASMPASSDGNSVVTSIDQLPSLAPPVAMDERPGFSFGVPVVCRDPDNDSAEPLRVHPISFAIPPSNLLRGANRPRRTKLWDFAPLIPVIWPGLPGFKYPLQVADEWIGSAVHERSFFAWTHKRGGWDCLRHYEILAGGAVPFFVDAFLMPPDCVTSLPKALIWEAMTLAANVPKLIRPRKQVIKTPWVVYVPKKTSVTFQAPAPLDHDRFNFTRYFEIADAIYSHTVKYLTTPSLANYVLSTMNSSDAKHVLLILPDVGHDYLAAAMVNGLFELGVPTTIAGDADALGMLFAMHGTASTSPSEAPKPSLEDLEEHRSQSGRSKAQGGGWVYGFRTKFRPWQPFTLDYKTDADRQLLTNLMKDGGRAFTEGTESRELWMPGLPKTRSVSAAVRTAVVAEAAKLPRVDTVIYLRRSVDGIDRAPLWDVVREQVPERARRGFIDGWDMRDNFAENEAIARWARDGTLFRREIPRMPCKRVG